MEVVLLAVTGVSLALAVAMSIVAFVLLRQERQRTAARVEALGALAFADSGGPTTAGESVIDDAIASRHTPEPGDETDADAWDSALGAEPTRRTAAVGRGTVELPLTASTRMFDHAPASGVSGRRWLALAAIVLVVLAGVAIAASLRSPEIVAAVAASRPDSSAQPLELLSLKHTNDPEGAFVVTGLVQNPAEGTVVEGVEAVVYLFDDSGKYFANGRSALDLLTMAPNDESPFVVRVPNVSGVSRYRVTFRKKDGRAIAHVDRRGRWPSGATGGAIHDQTELATPAGGMRPIDGIYRP